jgi:mRNA-degrading endonuclease RelE of RelBE toxin-antitoxin system
VQYILHKEFKKDVKRLPPKIGEQFLKRGEIFKINPFDPVLNNHSVHKKFPNGRSINVTGDYRAIYKEKDGIAIFITIGTHA